MEKLDNRPTILVVDDASDNLAIIESSLGNDYSLKLFSESKEALDYAFANPPDLILLDILMPNIDGFEFCRQLKENPKFEGIPVIFITSKNEDEYEEHGFAVGASDFIHKPINAPILIARVKTHLKIKMVIEYLKNENRSIQGSKEQSTFELLKIIKVLCDNPFLKF